MFFVIASLLCVMQSAIAVDVDHVKSWGDLSTSRNYFTRIESKIGIPFFHREFTVSYPEVSFDTSIGCRRNIKFAYIYYYPWDFLTERKI